MSKPEPIVNGVVLVDPLGHHWEVIARYPGGLLTMFDKKRTRFVDRYHKQVKDWPRAPAPSVTGSGEEQP